MPSNNKNFAHNKNALTLVEILVVITIITILASAFVVATSTVLNKSRTTNTLAVLQVVMDAVESFKREQSERPTITRAVQGQGSSRVTYKKRYGLYPPDELEVFSSLGLPGSKPAGKSLARPAVIFPDAGQTEYGPMRFYTDTEYDKNALEHRDLAAMILAIELFSPEGAAALSRLPDRNRTAGPLGGSGTPNLFLDRASTSTPNGKWDDSGEDYQIRYIVDGWGNPINYLAQRDFNSKKPTASAPSSNHARWNEASTEIIRLNRGQPVLFSYGPDGEDQLTKEWMEDQPGSSESGEDFKANASLISDFEDDHKINHHLNKDNVYLDSSLHERLNQGIEEKP